MAEMVELKEPRSIRPHRYLIITEETGEEREVYAVTHPEAACRALGGEIYTEEGEGLCSSMEGERFHLHVRLLSPPRDRTRRFAVFAHMSLPDSVMERPKRHVHLTKKGFIGDGEVVQE